MEEKNDEILCGGQYGQQPTTPVPLSGDFCEQMRKAHEMGYDAIEIHVPDVSVLDIPAIQACMRETGMEVATLGTGTIYGRYGASSVRCR